jgi:hypothetical protein
MAGQGSGRSAPEYGVPTGAKVREIEVAQTRDLDFNSLWV